MTSKCGENWSQRTQIKKKSWWGGVSPDLPSSLSDFKIHMFFELSELNLRKANPRVVLYVI